MKGQRRTVSFRFPLGARVVWFDTTYVVERRRWEEWHRLGPMAVQYGLVERQAPGPIVAWVDEADLQEDERLQGS